MRRLVECMRRAAAVAGQFYEGERQNLESQLDRCIPKWEGAPQKFLGVIAPHAGYQYSGGVAGELYARLSIPSRLVILCPNHTGMGSAAAIMTAGVWETPLGDAEIDAPLAAALVRRIPFLRDDAVAHAREHSLEVQIPFLQRLARGFRFVPICLAHLSLALCEQLGEGLAETIAATAEPVGIIASSDMNHYEDQTTTLAKDQLAIDQVLALSARGLYETVHRREISMCGVIPATVMLEATRRLGSNHADLVAHATSGDVNGDTRRVVGYASMRVA